MLFGGDAQQGRFRNLAGDAGGGQHGLGGGPVLFRRGGRLRFGFIAAKGEDDIDAFAGEMKGGVAAETAAAPGDDGYLVGEFFHFSIISDKMPIASLEVSMPCPVLGTTNISRNVLMYLLAISIDFL